MNERIDYASAVTAFIAALIAGAVTLLRHQRAYSLMSVIAALLMSGLAGLGCWLACAALHLPEILTAICTGFAGHIGAELSRLIEQQGQSHAFH